MFVFTMRHYVTAHSPMYVVICIDRSSGVQMYALHFEKVNKTNEFGDCQCHIRTLTRLYSRDYDTSPLTDYI